MTFFEALQQWFKRLTGFGVGPLQFVEPATSIAADEPHAPPVEPVPASAITVAEPEQELPDLKTLLAETEQAVAARKWPEADLAAAALRTSYPLNRTGWLMGAVALREQRRYDDAEAVLREGLQTFPDDRAMLESYAVLAQVRRDTAAAIARWQALIHAVPDHLGGYQGLVAALRDNKQLHDAQAELAPALEKFPAAPELLMEKGRLASSRKDWAGATEAWSQVIALKPDALQPKLEMADILLSERKLDEAASVLAAASAQFPENREIGIREALLASRRRDWPEAERLWRKLDVSFPDNTQILGGLAEALWANKDEDGLVPTLDKLITLQPDNVVATILYARYEMYKNRAVDAVSRLQAACEKRPDNKMLLTTLSDARLQALATDSTDDAKPLEDPPSSTFGTGSLFEQFESLGSGCEFGLLQRHFGAEPLGLLRWATVSMDGVTAMLESRFAGIGDIEQTSIRPEGHSYALIDRRYGLSMQTFISLATEGEETLLPKLCNRQRFLARKLAEDLDNGDRIFVYKAAEPFDDNDVLRLWRALRGYGNNALLVAAPATAERAPGSLETLEDGLMIGFVSQFSNTDIATQDWTSICTTAASQWTYSRQHAKAVAAGNAWA